MILYSFFKSIIMMALISTLCDCSACRGQEPRGFPFQRRSPSDLLGWCQLWTGFCCAHFEIEALDRNICRALISRLEWVRLFYIDFVCNLLILLYADIPGRPHSAQGMSSDKPSRTMSLDLDKGPPPSTSGSSLIGGKDSPSAVRRRRAAMLDTKVVVLWVENFEDTFKPPIGVL